MIGIKPGQGNKKVFVHIDNLHRRSKKAIKNALYEIGAENVRYTKKLILSKNKTGKLYPFRGGLHQASAPGEAPANMTGALYKSIDYIVRGSAQMEFGDKVFYGKFLEDGTRRMEARPHLVKTVRVKARDAIAIFTRYFRKDVSK